MTKQPQRSFLSFPSLSFPFDEEEEGWMQDLSDPSGLSVYEDTQAIYVEAALPGMRPEDIEMTFDKGQLWIKAERKEQEEGKNKKYYRKATHAFSYHVAVPGAIDEASHPDAIFKNGILKVSFQKTQQQQPKKIAVKAG